MADKYEMLKQGIDEYKGVYGQEQGFSAVLELIEVLDKMADETQENANNDLISKDEWDNMTYSEKVKLKQNEPNKYNNAIKGEFK